MGADVVVDPAEISPYDAWREVARRGARRARRRPRRERAGPHHRRSLSGATRTTRGATRDGRDRRASGHGDGHQSLIRNGCGHVLTVPHIVVDGDHATGRSYALNIRWDPGADRFWLARVSANTWRWARTPRGWRITERVNASLDGTAEHREMLAP
jgi:hypothetical protein